MKRTLALLFQALITVSVSAQQFREIASKEKKISYNGYEIQTRFNPRSRTSSAVVRKNGRMLINKHFGWGHEDRTQIALFSVLGGATKQLIIEQYTGGAHCCGF